MSITALELLKQIDFPYGSEPACSRGCIPLAGIRAGNQTSEKTRPFCVAPFDKIDDSHSPNLQEITLADCLDTCPWRGEDLHPCIFP